MEHRGLRSSAWARERNEDKSFSSRPGDWVCSSCGLSNFQRRLECFRCSHAAMSAVSEDDVTVRNQRTFMDSILSLGDSKLGDSKGVSDEVTQKYASQEKTGSELVTDKLRYVSSVGNEANGLSTSRWAPRNYTGRRKPANSGEVWTRVTPAPNVTSNSSANTSPAIFNPPDLGLPYEVQHFILTMMQRMLEEACYDFASRWIPKYLLENQWTCSEAVELSTWRSILPAVLPRNSIVPVNNYSLEMALSDAVRIRNSAVHRHLCDNVEIMSMALHAQDLVSMFSDAARQSKLYRLRAELHHWDNRGERDPESARMKLQEALQEISERSVDGMDWTPNAVSLEEIAPSTDNMYEFEEQYIDEMELD